MNPLPGLSILSSFNGDKQRLEAAWHPQELQTKALNSEYTVIESLIKLKMVNFGQ